MAVRVYVPTTEAEPADRPEGHPTGELGGQGADVLAAYVATFADALGLLREQLSGGGGAGRGGGGGRPRRAASPRRPGCAPSWKPPGTRLRLRSRRRRISGGQSGPAGQGALGADQTGVAGAVIAARWARCRHIAEQLRASVRVVTKV